MLLGSLLSLGSQVGGGRGALEVAGEDRLDEGVEDNLSSAVHTMAVSYQIYIHIYIKGVSLCNQSSRLGLPGLWECHPEDEEELEEVVECCKKKKKERGGNTSA